ncbi:2'-5' RNA ligase family protein [Georgenia sp. Z1491]|uniref:2'-5' RNA ligase family protein n=1 Tax=Georgenia sp. Z1491 TaxID=3416707 RepID=UPI003CEC04DE
MRLFAAIRPPAEVLDHLELPLTNLRLGAGAPLRWVPVDQQHVTVAFYGEVPDGAVGDVADSLAEAAARHAPLDLRLRGGGSFSGRILWVGVGGETARLTVLMADAADAPYVRPPDPEDQDDDEPGAPARGNGRGRQERRRAHLTVARESRRSRGTDMAGLASALAVYEGPTWRADAVELVSSRLGEGPAGGPLHQVQAVIPLAGPA